MLLAARSLRRAAGASTLLVSNRSWALAASARAALASSMMPLASSENLVEGDRNHQRPPPSPPSSPPLRAVPASKLIAANVYISEGRDKAVIDRLVRVLGGWKGQGRSDETDVNSFDFVSSSKAAASTSPSSSSTPSSSSPPPPAAAAAALVHVFVDEPYNRTGFTIAGLSSEEEEEDESTGGGGGGGGGEAATRGDSGRGTLSPSSPPSSVPAAISLLARESLQLVDWRLAGGTHPAIGVVDHVAVHALFPDSEGSAEEAARAARKVARALGEELGVPTYLYGSASSVTEEEGGESWRKLAEVRRALGYFGPSTSSSSSRPKEEKKGSEPPPQSSSSSSSFFARFPDPLPRPDSGPARAEPSKGAAAVGSVPWVMNVNVPLVFVEEGEGGEKEEEGESSLASFSAAAAAVARAVSARRGTPMSQGGFALPGVEALALAHRPGVVEVACNLTDGGVRPEEVARAVELAARAAGLRTQKKTKVKSADKDEDDDDDDDDDSSWYVTGKRPEEVAAEAARALGLEIVL